MCFVQGVVTLEFLGELLQATRMSEAELKIELSLTLFVKGKLSFGKACEMAGIDCLDVPAVVRQPGYITPL